jgi:hypothetical protein
LLGSVVSKVMREAARPVLVAIEPEGEIVCAPGAAETR